LTWGGHAGQLDHAATESAITTVLGLVDCGVTAPPRSTDKRGPAYQPQTGIGNIAQIASSLAPGLVLGAPAMLARGTEMGEGMEAADQFFNKIDPWNWVTSKILPW
jgi:hypothetical protein